MLAGPLGRRHPPWMQECRLACWRAGWGFIRSRLTTYRTGKFLDARGTPARAFQESHCGTNNAVVYLHRKLNSVWDRSEDKDFRTFLHVLLYFMIVRRKIVMSIFVCINDQTGV